MTKEKDVANIPANYDEELAAIARAEMERSKGGSGQFIKFSNTGNISVDGEDVKDNQLLAVIMCAMDENTYYIEDYDPDVSRGAPDCYAYGAVGTAEDEEMKPHKKVVDSGTAQCEVCSECDWNKFGSAKIGKGKACRQTKRIMVLSAGEFLKDGTPDILTDADDYKTQAPYTMKLNVTSVKNFNQYVTGVSAAINKPVFAVVTRIFTEPDKKSFYKIKFEMVQELEPELIGGVLLPKYKECIKLIDAPYPDPIVEDEEDTKPAKKKPTTGKKKKY